MPDARGIRAGAAYVEVFLKDNLLVKGLDTAAKKLKAFGASVSQFGQSLAAYGGVVLGPFTGALYYFKNYGDSLNKMSLRTGVATEALSQLSFAAEQSGSDLGTLEAGLKGMQRFLALAASGSKSAQKTLADLGLTIEELKDLAPDEQLSLIADGIAKVEDVSKRANLAMTIFTKAAGHNLLPFLQNGAQGIAALRQEADLLGLTVGTEQAQAAADLQDAYNRLMRTIKAITFAIGGALAPAVTDLFGKIQPVLVLVRQWAKQNGQLLLTIAAVTAGVVSVGTAAIWLGLTLKSFGVILGLVLAPLGALVVVLKALLTPFGLVIAGLTSLGVAWLVMRDRGETAAEDLRQSFNKIGDEFHTVWSSIVTAVQAGDLELALEIVGASMRRIWAGVMLSIREGWNNTIRSIAKTLQDNPWILPLAGGIIGAKLGGPWGAVAGGLAGVGLTIFADDIAEMLTVELKDATERLEKAKKELSELVKRGRELPPKAVPEVKPRYPTPDELRKVLVGSRGAFALPFAAAQLGLDDRVKRQEELLDDLLDNVKEIKDIVQGAMQFG